MKRIFSCLLFLITMTGISQKLETPFEMSDGNYTGTYDEVISFYQELARKYDVIQIKSMGMTDSGYPLHLVLFDPDKNFDPSSAHEKGKGVLLINNGIHPGEPDGIEASMMWLRDLASNKKKSREVENHFIGIIPIYNIGGSLNRNSFTRANQEGPEAYGFRGNAQNRDLNRDFIKMDTRNAMAFAEIFHYMSPDVFIDTHVSNGADYQYTITHLATQPDKLGGALGAYMQNTMIPVLESHMAELKAEITPYVNSFGTTPDKGYGIFFDAPRYSTGYTTLFNTLGFMIETHMLKPFSDRVNSTYQFFEASTRILIKDKDQIKSMRREAANEILKNGKYTLTWNRNREKSREITFKGYEGSMIDSPFGGQRLFYDRSKPFEKVIPYYDRFDPGIQVEIPQAYIIPQGWHKVLERLSANKIEMLPISSDTIFKVEAYRISNVEYSRSPYEGHFLHRNIEISKESKSVSFRKGDFYIPSEQPGVRYLLETLEPEATDSYFHWNFFDAIMQQKEYFSSYVFEDIAIQLLKANPDMNSRFEAEKVSNPEFTKSRRAQLDWIYRNSPYYEPAHLSYPVYRLVK